MDVCLHAWGEGPHLEGLTDVWALGGPHYDPLERQKGGPVSLSPVCVPFVVSSLDSPGS